MFNWWLGKASEDAISGDGKSTIESQYRLSCCTNTNFSQDLEPPETPAPVFAARAFKSAIFGTPVPPDEDGFEVSLIGAQTRSRSQSGAGSSPTKPQGILLTPGTGATRRKTVSFGAGVVDNGAKDKPVIPGKFPSPWTPRADETLPSIRPTALTRTMEAARDSRSVTSGLPNVDEPMSSQQPPATRPAQSRVRHDEQGRKSEIVLPKDAVQEARSKLKGNTAEDFDADVTLDINEPRSQSGQYWKSEYERYHDEAKAEMRKLVRYKQLAKSYAKKKDGEAIDLGEKLREEQQKVSTMEGKVSELSAQLAARRINDADDETSELVKELSRQTALAIEYRAQVDQFQIALRERNIQSEQQSESSKQRFTSPKTARTLLETCRELSKARSQLAEMGILREEMHKMRITLSTAEKKASKLQDENAKLSRQLAQVNDDLERSEKRRQSAETHNLEQDKALQSMHREYESLKELAKSQRREAEGLLKKRHDQVAELKREIKSFQAKVEASNLAEAKKSATEKSTRESTLPQERMSQVVQPTAMAPHPEDLMFFPGNNAETLGEIGDLPTTQGQEQGTSRRSQVANASIPTGVLEQVHRHHRRKSHLLDSKVPLLNPLAENYKTGKREDSGQIARNAFADGNSRPRHNVLAEIINDASVDVSPVNSVTGKGSHLSASFQERFSNLSISAPQTTPPPPLEPSFGGAQIHRQQEHRGITSPRPSMANIPSSPPKRALSKPPPTRRDVPANLNANPSSSRHSSITSSRSRVVLPPDRAAAARARLEQKNAVKRRAQDMGQEKENRV